MDEFFLLMLMCIRLNWVLPATLKCSWILVSRRRPQSILCRRAQSDFTHLGIWDTYATSMTHSWIFPPFIQSRYKYNGLDWRFDSGNTEVILSWLQFWKKNMPSTSGIRDLIKVFLLLNSSVIITVKWWQGECWLFWRQAWWMPDLMVGKGSRINYTFTN